MEKAELWYALFVNTNSENKVQALIEKQMGDRIRAIVPTRELKERKDGKWHFVKRKLFPGYVLINGNVDVDTYYEIKKISGIIKFLGDDDELHTIPGKELRILKILIDEKKDNIGISTLLKEDDNIKVIDGPLVGLEGQIVKVNWRKGRAKVRLNFMDDVKLVELGIESISK